MILWLALFAVSLSTNMPVNDVLWVNRNLLSNDQILPPRSTLQAEDIMELQGACMKTTCTLVETKIGRLVCQWSARRYSCYHNFAIYFHHDIIDCSPSHTHRIN
jgi:hypothetical protein